MALNLRGGSGLRGSRLSQKEDADPMASVANIADIMLVFACGLMMALVTVWNIDFTPLSQVEDSQLKAIDSPEDMPDDIDAQGSAYIEKGAVYQDPKTGKYYMITEDKDTMDADLADSASADASSGSDSSTTGSSSSSSDSDTKSRAAAPSGAKSSGSSSGSSSAPDRSAGAD